MPATYRKAILKKLSQFWNNYPRIRIITKTFLGVMGLFLVDSMRTLYLMSVVVTDDPITPASTDEMRIKLFSAQRYELCIN